MEWVALSAGRCGSECVEYSGFPGSTFGDCDFAIIGIILGFLGNTFGRMEIYGLLTILLVIIFIS